MMKRLISLLLTLALLLMVPIAKPAVAANIVSGEWTYSLSNGNALLVAYSGQASQLTIPSTIDGYPVTELGERLMEGNHYVVNLVLPTGLGHIRKNAFANCSNLQSVWIPKTLNSTDSSNDWNGGGVFAGCSKLQTVTFEAGTTKIANGLFCNANLNAITIPETVTVIGGNAFRACPFTSVVIPNAVTEIQDTAFIGCQNLSSLSLSSSLRTLGKSVFSGCRSLTSIHIPKSLESAVSSTAWNGDGVFAKCDNLKNVTFEAGTTRIASGLFCNSAIELITIPDTVTLIGQDAFRGSQLAILTMPDSVERVDYTAFQDCTRLGMVTLSKNLKHLDNNAFQNCTALTRITIPKSLEYAGHQSGPFNGCTNLKQVTIEAGMTTIPAQLFRNTSFSSIQIPDTVVSMGNDAFRSSKLSTLTLPDSVEKLGYSVFQDCTSLTQVDLGNIRSIDNASFQGCTALTQVTLPKSLEYAGHKGGIFGGCTKLKTILLEEGATTVPNWLFANSKVENALLPTTVTHIGDNAFEGCAALQRIVLPKAVASMGNNVFKNCPATLYLYEDSYSVIYAIDHQLPFVFLETGIADAPDRILDRSKCAYQATASKVSASGYVQLKVSFAFKDSVTGVSEPKLILRLPSTVEVTGFKLDGTEVEPSKNDANLITLPIKQGEGVFTFQVKPQDVVYLLSYARLSYWQDGQTRFETIGTVNIGNQLFTLNLADITTEETFLVTGVTAPEQTIRFTIDNQEVGHTISSKVGSYSANLTLPEAKKNRLYTVKAIQGEGEEAEIRQGTVRFVEDAPVLTGFQMTYEYAHTGTEKTLDLMAAAGTQPLITAYIHTPMTFTIDIANAGTVEEVYVTSNKNGTVKKIKAEYNPTTGQYVATGYFDPNDIAYMPGVINVEYLSSGATKSVVPGDDVDFTQFEDRLPEELKDSTVTVTQPDEDTTEVDIQLDMALGDLALKELKLITHTISKGTKEFDDILGGYDDLASYFVEGYDGKRYYKTIDYSDPYSCLTIVHDVANNEIIRYTLEGWDKSNTKVNVQGILSTLDDVSTVSGLILDFHNNETDYEDLCEKIHASNLSAHEKGVALDKAEALKNDKQMFTVLTTIISMVAATSGPVGVASMAAAPLVFGVIFGSISIASSFFFSMRETQILSGSNGFSARWIMDPSGYVYDKMTGHRLEGATATLYFKATEGDKPVVWNAAEYEQQNPLITDQDGRYAWDVPEGLWQVKIEMEGYQDGYSDWLPVPPPQLDVNIGLVPDAMPGDVDGDGTIGAADALKVLQHAVKLITLSDQAFTLADVNYDDTLSAADALRILQYAVKLIDSFQK